MVGSSNTGATMYFWRRAIVVVVCGVSGLSACAVVVPYQKGNRQRVGWDKYHTWDRDETGLEYCSRLAVTADERAQRKLVVGIVATMLAAAAVIAGSAMGADTEEKANWAQKNRNTLVIGAGGLLAIPAGVWLARSASASTASASAGKAMSLQGAAAMEACLNARTIFVGDRATSANGVKSELDTYAARYRELEAQLQKAKDEAALAQQTHAARQADATATPEQKAAAAAQKEAADAVVTNTAQQLEAAQEALLNVLRE